MFAAQRTDWQNPAASAPEILLVDDDLAILRGLRRAILALRPDWHVHVAEGGAVALRMMRERPYDLLVTDLEMPGLDGLGLLGSVEREFPNVVRLVHSSSARGRDVGRLALATLRKPASPRVVVETIENALCRAPSGKYRIAQAGRRSV